MQKFDYFTLTSYHKEEVSLHQFLDRKEGRKT